MSDITPAILNNHYEYRELYDPLFVRMIDGVDIIQGLMKQYRVPEEVAEDIYFLRVRFRWTKELEDEYVQRYHNGESIDIKVFGMTPENHIGLRNDMLRQYIENTDVDLRDISDFLEGEPDQDEKETFHDKYHRIKTMLEEEKEKINGNQQKD